MYFEIVELVQVLTVERLISTSIAVCHWMRNMCSGCFESLHLDACLSPCHVESYDCLSQILKCVSLRVFSRVLAHVQSVLFNIISLMWLSYHSLVHMPWRVFEWIHGRIHLSFSSARIDSTAAVHTSWIITPPCWPLKLHRNNSSVYNQIFTQQASSGLWNNGMASRFLYTTISMYNYMYIYTIISMHNYRFLYTIISMHNYMYISWPFSEVKVNEAWRCMTISALGQLILTYHTSTSSSEKYAKKGR